MLFKKFKAEMSSAQYFSRKCDANKYATLKCLFLQYLAVKSNNSNQLKDRKKW